MTSRQENSKRLLPKNSNLRKRMKLTPVGNEEQARSGSCEIVNTEIVVLSSPNANEI